MLILESVVRKLYLLNQTTTGNTTMTIKFNKHNVTNTKTKAKARIFYSLDNRTDHRLCVTLYAKDFGSPLQELFAAEYQNDTDTMTDYFEKGKVVLFPNHPLYQAARERAAA